MFCVPIFVERIWIVAPSISFLVPCDPFSFSLFASTSPADRGGLGPAGVAGGAQKDPETAATLNCEALIMARWPGKRKETRP